MFIDTNTVWKNCLIDLDAYGSEVTPRNMAVKEICGYNYTIDMQNPIITLHTRKMNYGFMFGEAGWVTSGSNWLDDVTDFMRRYEEFSDDGVYLNGAYGVKVAEQATYVVNTLVKDKFSRQAVLNIWRERPAESKDIPCTLSMQFMIRENRLDLHVCMRSQDAVLGMSYDIFTFSSVAQLIRVLLSQRGVDVKLGYLRVNAGSFHIYEEHWPKINTWLSDVVPHEQSDQALRDWEYATRITKPKTFTNYLREIAYDYP